MKYVRVLLLMVVVLGAAIAADAATATWDRNPEATVTGYRLSYGTQSGVHPTIIDVGNVITFQFFPPAGQRYYVVVQAINTTGLSSKSAEVILDVPPAGNQPPVLTQPATQSSVLNTAVSLTLVGSDPDGTPVTYSATGLPPGLSVNASTGVIAGTVTTAGTFNVTATASDGSLTASRTFTWTVAAGNQPPVLTQPANQSSTQNTAVSLTLVATDPNGTAVTYGATGLPSGLSVNASTGVIAGTVTTTGTFNVTATASDGSLTASRTFSWTVTAGSGGAPVTVTLSPADTTIKFDATNSSTDPVLYTYTYPTNRVANAILMKFDVSQIPAGATVQSAVLQLALVNRDGYSVDPTYNVSLHQVLNRNPDITRATGMTADGVLPWTPNTCCLNNVPLAQADLSPARAVTAVDRNLGLKTWDAISLVQAWLGTPTTNFGLVLNADATKGSDRFRFFASSEDGNVSQRPVLRITYTPAGGGGNDTTAPAVALSAPANGATVSGMTVPVSATATDAVGVAGVQFRLDGANLGAEDTTSPYSVNWDTTTAANGTHTLTAVARDAAGNTATATARTVTVSNAVANRAPTLTQPTNQTTAEGNVASLALVATDPDGNALTYTATGLPGGLAVNASTGLISGTLSFTSAGAYTVTATASDGSLSQSRTFSWTVTNTNRAPVLAQPANQSSMVSATVSLTLSATDPDGTAVTYQATGLPPGLSINSNTGVIAGTLSASSAGLYTVNATASDGSLTSSRTFAWSVGNTDTPVQGDFDGDGRDDPATYRASTGEWRVWPSAGNYVAANPIVWGGGTDLPIPADYDGDHETDIAVYRLSTGTWHVLLSSTNMQTSLDIVWGNSTDRPMPIDYDGDGRADLALPRFGGFEILLSGTNYQTSVTVR